MSTLANIGYDLGLNHGPIRRIVFCLTTADSGSANVISLSDAAAIANWRTKFDTYNFAADPSVKFVPTPLVRQVAFVDGEPTKWEVEDYSRIMRQAPSDLNFSLLDPSPYILKNLADMENSILSVFFVTEDNYALSILDGTDLKPFPIQANSLNIPYYKFAGYDAGSDNVISFRLSSGSDRNMAVAVQIADGSVTDASDFYSLRDATGTVSLVSANGCTIAIAVDDKNPSAPATSIPVTGCAYGAFDFRDAAAPNVPIILSGAGELVETSGSYVITKSAIFTSGHTYSCRVTKSGYDIIVGTITFT